MSTNFLDIKKALSIYYFQNWKTVAAYDESTYVNLIPELSPTLYTDNKEYVAYYINFSNEIRNNVGKCPSYTMAGVVYSVVNIPKPGSEDISLSDRAYELCDYISTVLKEKSFKVTDKEIFIRTLQPDVRKIGLVDQYFTMTVSVPFRADYFSDEA